MGKAFGLPFSIGHDPYLSHVAKIRIKIETTKKITIIWTVADKNDCLAAKTYTLDDNVDRCNQSQRTRRTLDRIHIGH